MHPGDLAGLQDHMRTLRDSGEAGGRFHSRFRTATGGWRWVSGAGRVLLDADGHVVGGIDTLRDMQAEHDATVALKASDAHFRLLAENTTDVVVQLTVDGRVSWISPSVVRVLGWSAEEVVGRSGFDLLHPDDGPALSRMLAQLGVIGASTVRVIRVRRRDGGYMWMEASSQHVPANANAQESLVSRLRNVDAQQRAFHELTRSEERFRTAMASAPIGMAVESVSAGLTEVNPALCTMLGRPARWLLAHPLLEVVHRQDEDRYRSMRETALDAQVDSVVRELRLVTAEERTVYVQLALGVVRDEIGQPTSLVWQILDVTETRRAQEVLEFLAAHDPLTDVKNRRALIGTLTSNLSTDPEAESRVGVLYADIDGLKPVNDRLGHAAGDTLIIEVARRFSRVLGADDTMGRLGGDEFVALLFEVSGVQEAAEVAERVRLAVSEPLDIDGVEVSPAVSVGVACAQPGERPEALLRRADGALYRAKKAGGNSVVVDDPGIKPSD
jgi:diguanylate cyclase (GGDEF)-like protein/PAS domain S-box-containing protein